MNICIDLNKFFINYISFLETKRNIIMEGNFTKLLYSNQYFTMNNIFIYLPIEYTGIEKVTNKNFLKFNPLVEKNSILIKELSSVELKILEYYKLYFNSKRKVVNLLSRQLNSGNIKVLCDKKTDNYSFNKSMDIEEYKKEFILKISGVWETYEDIGLTYKLLEISTRLN